ncbi:MAG: LptF/LptG family permease [Sedimentisphaerales bacterium]|nr:LptF/LptG family permease [Sedimentisphaerales bacterium]
MVLVLHRYILRELMKVFLLASIGLTLILSLGGILRPVQEYGVGPGQVLSLMSYFLPITLTFVLPMAALFASALVYGRFASDNELDACRASGVSIVTLVYPGLALAITVAIVNLILSFHMLPYFVHLAEKSLKADAKQILFRNIQRRGHYALPSDNPWLLYADDASLATDTLTGVVLVRARNGVLETVYAAESATVKFDLHERFNEVQITTNNTFQIDSDDEVGFSVEQAAVSAQVGSLLSDSINFKKINEMKRIRNDLMLFGPIEKLARNTNAQFTIEMLCQEIESKTAVDPNGYYRLYSGEKLVDFRADTIVVDVEKVKLDGNIVVIESDPDGVREARTLRPGKASIHIEGDKLAPTLTMDLHNVIENESGVLKMRHLIRGLVRPAGTDIRERFGTQNILKAISLAADSAVLKKGPSGRLSDLTRELKWDMAKTLLQISAEIQTRLVFGIGCVPMILIGIGIGIIKKGGHLLTAFGASCIPAAVLIVCIVGGKQVMQNQGSAPGLGMSLIWAGLVFLLFLAGVIYYKLLKN